LSAFNLKNSSDDIFLRSALVAMISDLNNVLEITYTKPDQSIIKTTIPFFIDIGIGSNDRFYRDFYYRDEYKDCVIIHNYDRVPRVHVTPGGISLNPDQMTSPFGQAEYTQTIEGKEKWVSSFVHMLPISIDLDFQVKASTFTEVLKIWQAIVDYGIYSSIPSNFIYRGINCDSTISIEVPNVSKEFSFTSEDITDELLGFTFSGRYDTFYPAVRDKWITNIIENFKTNIEDDLGKLDINPPE
jgi:hypothetical protein